MNLKIGILTASLSFIGACTQSPPVAKHTVEQYLANDALRAEQIARCGNDPGTIGKTPDCINALEAEDRAGRGSFSKRFRPTPPPPPTSAIKNSHHQILEGA
jgi:hypothetical protein